jgi:squalene-hopene/tetraprenyl-beta-curcumene cyclase
MPRLAAPTIAGRAAGTLARARDCLLAQQDETGWWKGELETNVTMEAEDLLMRRFLGVPLDDVLEPTAAWIRRQQRADGTWAKFYGGPGDLSTTIEAYAALRLAGDPSDAAHLRLAREFILEGGGLASSRVFTRLWLALFGEWSWDELPALPPELIFLPSRVPLNIYDWACWARQTIVPLTVIAAHRPRRDLGFTLDELRVAGEPAALPDAAPSLWARRFARLDRVLKAYERRPNRRLRREALRRAAAWIVRRQEADGSWGGIQPPWVYSMMALNVLGYGTDDPVMKAAFAGLDGFTVTEGGLRRLEACQSPVWDTALAMIALSDAGLPGDHEALRRAGDLLLHEQILVSGDWSVRRPALRPGGWAFEFENDNYPDIDDTAEVVMALRRLARGPLDGADRVVPQGMSADFAGATPQRASAGRDRAISRGLEWLLGMQCGDGGWGAFDADNTRELICELPFCDFGAVIDPPSADVTAHVLEMLGGEGLEHHERARRGLRWLMKAQLADGSWFGRWGANYVYGTGAAVPAAVAAGVSPRDPSIRRAVGWLATHQNGDGGWGEDLRSYDDPAGWSGRGESTASQTAWALLALLAAGEQDSPTVERGVAFLCETQTPSGTWDEPFYTGTGFPGDFYINYHLYRLVFPVQALGRYVQAVQGDGDHEGAGT